jgi:hypothetical protein
LNAAFRDGAQLAERRSRQAARPDRAFIVLDDLCTNRLACQRRVLSQLAVSPARQPFCCADPESPVARRQQVVNSLGGEMLTLWRLPGDSLDTIEAEQPEFRAQP